VSEYIHKSHNVPVLIYHLVFPARFRRAVFDERVDETVKDVCMEIEKRYQVKFLEIGIDDQTHYGTGSVQTMPPGKKNSFGEGNSGRMDILQVL